MMRSAEILAGSHAVRLGIDEHALSDAVSSIVWSLFNAYKDFELFTFKKWFIQKTFYVRDIENLLTLWFGPNPALKTNN